MKIAIVGAGLTGLLAGRRLAERGLEPRLFDKGRRVGGRLSTRQVRGEAVAFDHGAQYFTARDPDFRAAAERWVEEGALAPWAGELVELRRGQAQPAKAAERFVGVPAMQALTAHLARDLHVECGVRIESIEHSDGGYRLHGESQLGSFDSGPFEALLICVPAPQAAILIRQIQASPLLGAGVGVGGVAEEFGDALDGIPMQPCWAVMASFEERLSGEGSASGADFDGAFIRESPLSWAARDGSKPGRHGETWVLHGSPEWSRDHLEDDPDHVATTLLDAFFEATGQCPVNPKYLRAHRWRYARPNEPHGDVLFDPGSRLGVGGDWSYAGRVEGAFWAGRALANHLLDGL